jgi:hypothetical protein
LTPPAYHLDFMVMVDRTPPPSPTKSKAPDVEESPLICTVCHGSMSPHDPEDPLRTLPCGDVFHADCIDTYISTTNMANTTLETMKCPSCRRTPQDCEIIDAKNVPLLIGAKSLVLPAPQPGAAPSGPRVDEVKETMIESVDSDEEEDEAKEDDGDKKVGEDTAPTPGASTLGKGEGSLGKRPFSEDALTVWCMHCGDACDALKCRLRSKTKELWRCHRCCSKITMLHRGFGCWPTPEFSGLNDAEKSAFYKSAQELGYKEMMIKANSVITKHQSHEQFFERGGVFLPLSVWANKGYDPETIRTKSKPENKSSHEVLGDVYRVAILATGERGARGFQSRHELEARPKKQLKIDELLLAIKGTPVPQPHELADEEDAEPEPSPASPTDDSSSSDSSSDSSSSSSSHDKKKKKSKKKKSKKVKKEKKKRKQKAAKKAAAALAKREKLDEKKAAQKKAAQEKSSAEKAAKTAKKESEQKKIHADEILHKVKGPLQGLNSQMGHTRLSELPESIVASSQAAQNDLVAIADNALAVKQGVSENLLFPSKQVGSFIAEARKMETIVKSMISALQKLRR